MRTILYTSERVTANNWETLMFITILLGFALVASGYVLMKGLVGGCQIVNKIRIGRRKQK